MLCTHYTDVIGCKIEAAEKQSSSQHQIRRLSLDHIECQKSSDS